MGNLGKALTHPPIGNGADLAASRQGGSTGAAGATSFAWSGSKSRPTRSTLRTLSARSRSRTKNYRQSSATQTCPKWEPYRPDCRVLRPQIFADIKRHHLHLRGILAVRRGHAARNLEVRSSRGWHQGGAPSFEPRPRGWPHAGERKSNFYSLTYPW